MGDNVCVCDCASVLCLNAWLTQGIPLHVALAGFGSNLRAPDSGMFKIDPANYALSRRQVSRVSRRFTVSTNSNACLWFSVPKSATATAAPCYHHWSFWAGLSGSRPSMRLSVTTGAPRTMPSISDLRSSRMCSS